MADRQPSTHLTNYRFSEEYIGRLNEDSALTSAHPDDCAIFAGPPRIEMIPENVFSQASETDTIFKLFGTFQSLTIGQNQEVIPMKAIGSSRFFFFTNNQPLTFGFALIMMDTDSLLKVILSNLLLLKGVDSALTEAFKGYVFSDFSDKMWFNVGSELYSIPFGLGILWSNKERTFLGSAYFESAYLASYNSEITAGRQLIMESGSFIADRVRPFPIKHIFESADEVGSFKNFRDEVKKYFGFK